NPNLIQNNNLSLAIDIAVELDRHYKDPQISPDDKVKNILIRSFESGHPHFIQKQNNNWFSRTWDRLQTFFSGKSTVPIYNLEENLTYFKKLIQAISNDSINTLSQGQLQYLEAHFHGKLDEALTTTISRLSSLILKRVSNQERKNTLTNIVDSIKQIAENSIKAVKNSTIADIQKRYQPRLTTLERQVYSAEDEETLKQCSRDLATLKKELQESLKNSALAIPYEDLSISARLEKLALVVKQPKTIIDIKKLQIEITTTLINASFSPPTPYNTNTLQKQKSALDSLVIKLQSEVGSEASYVKMYQKESRTLQWRIDFVEASTSLFKEIEKAQVDSKSETTHQIDCLFSAKEKISQHLAALKDQNRYSMPKEELERLIAAHEKPYSQCISAKYEQFLTSTLPDFIQAMHTTDKLQELVNGQLVLAGSIDVLNQHIKMKDGNGENESEKIKALRKNLAALEELIPQRIEVLQRAHDASMIRITNEPQAKTAKKTSQLFRKLLWRVPLTAGVAVLGAVAASTIWSLPLYGAIAASVGVGIASPFLTPAFVENYPESRSAKGIDRLANLTSSALIAALLTKATQDKETAPKCEMPEAQTPASSQISAPIPTPVEVLVPIVEPIIEVHPEPVAPLPEVELLPQEPQVALPASRFGIPSLQSLQFGLTIASVTPTPIAPYAFIAQWIVTAGVFGRDVATLGFTNALASSGGSLAASLLVGPVGGRIAAATGGTSAAVVATVGANMIHAYTGNKI
ncbi:MAG: hypothetical protein JWO53_995, partial [Chlamydiia bacterium]|nr:hypothetical protein [Chlamydiia bacterium]